MILTIALGIVLGVFLLWLIPRTLNFLAMLYMARHERKSFEAYHARKAQSERLEWERTHPQAIVYKSTIQPMALFFYCLIGSLFFLALIQVCFLG